MKNFKWLIIIYFLLHSVNGYCQCEKEISWQNVTDWIKIQLEHDQLMTPEWNEVCIPKSSPPKDFGPLLRKYLWMFIQFRNIAKSFESTLSEKMEKASSILESISYGLGDQNTGSALGSGGIWGGGNNVNQTASLGLAGLNFSSFMGNGGATRNENEGNDLAGGSTTWGTSTGGSGSIW